MKKILVYFAAAVFMLATAAPACQGRKYDGPWKGKRIAILGDSISDPRRIGTQECWWEFIAADWLLTADSYAKNGAQTNTFDQQAEKALKRQAEEGFRYDAIFIFGGTNDYNDNVPIGEWFSYEKAVTDKDGAMTELTKRTPIYGNETFKARLNKMLLYVKTSFPGVPVYILTPIHRGYAEFGRENVQPDDRWSNTLGLFIDDYVEAVKEAAGIWAVRCIDLYAECGLLPALEEYGDFIHDKVTDRLHPNAAGHRLMADTIENHIRK